jgi:hypothetical protein
MVAGSKAQSRSVEVQSRTDYNDGPKFRLEEFTSVHGPRAGGVALNIEH